MPKVDYKAPWKLTIDRKGQVLHLEDSDLDPIIVDWDISSDPPVGIFVDAEREIQIFKLLRAAPELLEIIEGFFNWYRTSDVESVDCEELLKKYFNLNL